MLFGGGEADYKDYNIYAYELYNHKEYRLDTNKAQDLLVYQDLLSEVKQDDGIVTVILFHSPEGKGGTQLEIYP